MKGVRTRGSAGGGRQGVVLGDGHADDRTRSAPGSTAQELGELRPVTPAGALRVRLDAGDTGAGAGFSPASPTRRTEPGRWRRRGGGRRPAEPGPPGPAPPRPRPGASVDHGTLAPGRQRSGADDGRPGAAPLAAHRRPHPRQGLVGLAVRDELAGGLLVRDVHRAVPAGAAGPVRATSPAGCSGRRPSTTLREQALHLPQHDLQRGGRRTTSSATPSTRS